MGVVRHSAVVNCRREDAFAYVNDHRTVPEWMFGVSTFDPVTETTYGPGAAFAVAMTLGPKSLTSTVEVTEFTENELVRLQAVKGFNAGTVWSFADAEDGTEVSVEFTYTLPGGIAGRAFGAVIEPVVGQAIRHTESKLRTRLEG